MRFSIIVPIILALAAAPAAADVYKWKNAEGETVYSQFPPAGVAAERVRGARTGRDAVGTPAQTPQERLKILQEQQNEAREQAGETAAQQQQAATRKENCANARNNLALLERGGHRRVRLPDGTVTSLDEEQIKQHIDKARQQIKDNCD